MDLPGGMIHRVTSACDQWKLSSLPHFPRGPPPVLQKAMHVHYLHQIFLGCTSPGQLTKGQIKMLVPVEK